MNIKRILFLALLLSAMGLAILFAFGPNVSAGPLQPAPQSRSTQKFNIDPVHSSILFRVKHLDVSNFYGMFEKFSGSFRVDDEDLDNSYIRIEVEAESVDSNNEGRDRHLKSQDFFSAKEFPTISFKSTKIEKSGKNTYKVTGDLTFRGVTRSISLEAEHTGTAAVSQRFGLRSGYEAQVDIQRSDFGDKYGVEDKVLSDAVRLVISVEGTPAM